jgi:hypothetical protein
MVGWNGMLLFYFMFGARSIIKKVWGFGKHSVDTEMQADMYLLYP